MRKAISPGARLRNAVKSEKPLQVVGVINAYCARLAERAGFRALYLSGAGVANASYGLPDLGFTMLRNVLEDVRRVTATTGLPLLVDADTGWENPERTAREMIRAGAGGMHLEDQVSAKRCGHRPGKKLVTAAEMVRRIRSAADGRTDRSFVIMARTDAAANEGIEGAIERARDYVAAGAEMIFAEALTSLEQYRRFTRALRVPVLANVTEFGRTPLFTTKQLGSAGIRLALYPLSAFRAISAAAEKTYETIRKQGTQKSLLASMQTREELYRVLDYHSYEKQANALLAKRKGKH